jgi:hypothetical protein
LPLFDRYLGIDYSGAQTAESSLTGLRVFEASPAGDPIEIHPPPGPKKYWTRRGLATWLAGELKSGPATLVGIDHGFSFPLRYFQEHNLPMDWPLFLEDFQNHWPTDAPHTCVDFIRKGMCGSGKARSGDSRWRRLTELQCRFAKSVFHFDVQGSVAKSTHSGLPWLLYLRRQLREKVHFWPFDGWHPPKGTTVIAEIYPALWSRLFKNTTFNTHQQDAFASASWMKLQDSQNLLTKHFNLDLSASVRKIAEIEGWILGCGTERSKVGEVL